MIYAPVVIPTLDRYEHFKRCLESLERCSGADRTTVYVGLDFPPAEKYVEGWKKIDNYLLEKGMSNNFAKLVIIRREHNYGVFGNESNAGLLCKTALTASDRLIFSEDDNEFAPSFLEYINKALELYKNDPRIMSVCGYSQPAYNKASIKTNQIFVQDNSAWGVGMWKEKEVLIDKFNQNWCKDVLNSFSKVSLVMRRFPMLVSMMINMLKSKTVYGDTIRTCANILNETLQVRPKMSLVRNWGNDGSGINCKKIIDISSEKLDMREHFELSDCDVARTKDLDKEVYNILLPKRFVLKYLKVTKIWCKYSLFRIGLRKSKQ